MPQPYDAQEDNRTKEFFDFLDRREKIGDWLLAIFGIAIFLSLILGGIALLVW